MVNTGSYQVYIKVKKQINIKIGALGEQLFDKGIYVYTGSAMNNLEKRVQRHIDNNKNKNQKSPRWHIDYLLSNDNVDIIKVEKFLSKIKEECLRNQNIMNLINSSIPVKHFGSTDCNQCPSHLIKIS